MIFFALLAVALVGGIAVLGLGGVTMTRERAGVGPVVALVGGVVVLVLLVAGGGLLLGVGGDLGSSDPDPSSRSASVIPSSATTAPTPSTPSTLATSARAHSVGFPGLGPGVTVRAATIGDLPAPALATGGLSHRDVVPVTATGFGRNIDGTARQCASRASTQSQSCTPGVPVRFDGIGAAEFLFLVSTEIGDGDERLRCTSNATCTLDVQDARGHRAVTVLVFGEPAPAPPEVRVDDTSVDAGEAVTVSVRGLAPRERVRIAQCAANEEGQSACGEPGPDVSVIADGRGAVSAELVVREGRVGRNVSVECSRTTTCGIAVVHADGLLRAAPIAVTLSAGPSADYDGMRLAVGLLVALVLAAGAVLLGVRTDWRGAPDPFA